MAVTRTINPLHFEDLEPHRFEDLVRQLVYEFRDWYKLEATGRLGSDAGVDIAALERITSRGGESEDEETAELDETRHWVLQCKRLQRIGPSDITGIVQEAIGERSGVHGLLIAAACDFSARTRAAFELAARAAGVQEYFLWGKAELEDLLFRPVNDHLLFAYFGISLQVRRRSLKTELRGRIATKAKLVRVLGEIRTTGLKTVLVRDAAADWYPKIAEPKEFMAKQPWRYYQFAGHLYPDHVGFEAHKHLAWVNDNRSEWDALEQFDEAWPHYPKIVGIPDELTDRGPSHDAFHALWLKIPDHNRAWLIETALIPYDSILAVDEHGDAYHEPPHLLVDFGGKGSPFTIRRVIIEAGYRSNEPLYPEALKHVKFFPVSPPPEAQGSDPAA